MDLSPRDKDSVLGNESLRRGAGDNVPTRQRQDLKVFHLPPCGGGRRCFDRRVGGEASPHRKAHPPPVPQSRDDLPHKGGGEYQSPSLGRLSPAPRLMKGCCHASFSTVRTFLRDVVEVEISRGELCNIIDKVSQALEGPDEELLLKEDILNVDETGHSASGARWWAPSPILSGPSDPRCEVPDNATRRA